MGHRPTPCQKYLATVPSTRSRSDGRVAQLATRRAALAGGPDVWEVIDTLGGTGLTGEKAVMATARWGSLAPAQVRAAVRYYAEYRDEVDERIRLNRQEAERERRSWERMQEALG